MALFNLLLINTSGFSFEDEHGKTGIWKSLLSQVLKFTELCGTHRVGVKAIALGNAHRVQNIGLSSAAESN